MHSNSVLNHSPGCSVQKAQPKMRQGPALTSGPVPSTQAHSKHCNYIQKINSSSH